MCEFGNDDALDGCDPCGVCFDEEACCCPSTPGRMVPKTKTSVIDNNRTIDLRIRIITNTGSSECARTQLGMPCLRRMSSNTSSTRPASVGYAIKPLPDAFHCIRPGCNVLHNRRCLPFDRNHHGTAAPPQLPGASRILHLSKVEKTSPGLLWHL